MATMNQKNIALSPAASDLGLGDQLRQAAEDNNEEMKKKKLMRGAQTAFGQAARDLLGGALNG